MNQTINNSITPKTINIHFTDKCNFVCHHCFVKKCGKELSLDNIKIIVDKIASYSKKNNESIRINLAGGEPLLSKNIQEIINYINMNDLKVSIITNGYYLTEEFINNNKNKLSMIGISVDSLDPDKNKIIGRCFKEEVLVEDDLVNICKKIKNLGIKLKINTCISTINVTEDLSNFYNMIDADRVKILRVLDQENKFNNCISDEDWKRVVLRYSSVKGVVVEDNNYMKNSYFIIDSEGNFSKNNLHNSGISLLNHTFEECLEDLNRIN